MAVSSRSRRTRLRRTNPAIPGLTRRRRGRGFVYLDAHGDRVTDPDTLARIEALVIPPAWRDVWICPYPNGHLQATGVDAAGRRQYRYHEAWTARRDEEKFQRALKLGLVLPDLRARLASDLSGRGLTRTRVLSCAVRLIDLGLFRIGGEEYAKENESYGIATVLREHVTLARGEVAFRYPAKSGMEGSQRLRDPVVRDVVRALVRRPDPYPELMGWWSPAERCWRDVRSQHINDHLRELTGQDVTAKDFRTWHATVLLATSLARVPGDLRPPARKRALAQAYKDVASALSNTPTVAKTSYCDPRVVDLFEHGVTIAPARIGPAADAEPGLGPDLVPTSASVAVAELLQS